MFLCTFNSEFTEPSLVVYAQLHLLVQLHLPECFQISPPSYIQISRFLFISEIEDFKRILDLVCRSGVLDYLFAYVANLHLQRLLII